jgi:hypothetical protein
MLEKNTSLGGLSCRDLEKYMTVEGMICAAQGLKKYHTLRVFDFGHNAGSHSTVPVDTEFFLPFEAMLEENEKSALWSLVICGKKDSDIGNEIKIKYWQELNKYKARETTRDGSINDFHSAVEKAIDAAYFLLRNNLQHILRRQLVHSNISIV